MSNSKERAGAAMTRLATLLEQESLPTSEDWEFVKSTVLKIVDAGNAANDFRTESIKAMMISECHIDLVRTLFGISSKYDNEVRDVW